MYPRLLYRGVLAALLSALLLALPVPVGRAAGNVPPPNVSPLIVDGDAATEPYPWMASLQVGAGNHFCGAVLVHPRWVATAGHCIQRVTEFQVRIGSVHRSSGGEVANSASFAVLPGDFVLVQLDRAVSATPIPRVPARPAVGSGLRLLGWGQTCASWWGCQPPLPEDLRQLDTTLVDAARCPSGRITPASEICVSNVGGKGACYGDSGGPAIQKVDGRWAVVGLTSRSGVNNIDCATGPAIYTDIVAYEQYIRRYAEGQE
nr:serine protease [Kibdelosporangium sp. MJ126-NF4]CEL14182.1 secreted trypsin-like serine protease [Kibdelosporangium sp. MJ126-NF4]CTQ88549.1 secreted trypsin-like serine protease [Kibdelosporangium sp. MJ126-NF4]